MSITDIRNHTDMYIDADKALDEISDLGKVTARTLPPCRPFEGSEPFPLDPAHFQSMADAMVVETPLGAEIDFDGIVLEDGDD